MPANRNALIRYRTIDSCLCNRFRKWTLDDLIEACSEALYEFEGIDKGISKRTIQLDIQFMRSDKLGYNAPIVVKEKKFYTYEDENYSIINSPLTQNDLGRLSEVVEILRQFKGFSHFQDLGGMVQKLEDKVFSAKNHTCSIIDFEKNEGLKGLEHLEMLYQAIQKKQALEISYQSFKAKTPNTITFHPYYLKEYRNRWFLLGKKPNDRFVQTLALDRMLEIAISKAAYLDSGNFELSKFYEDVVGVTVNEGKRPNTIHLFFSKYHAPYVLTKPIHHSQKVVEETEFGVEISLKVQINFELEREILGFGDGVKVLSPDSLKHSILKKLENAKLNYERET
ncbi:MAG: putative DNA-binding transcriptional regulator YafY [Flammeovirgaceae bacterium]|jgi:predicted DNA-binding transcriptional regulator YafY